jgi:hypothetical protein
MAVYQGYLKKECSTLTSFAANNVISYNTGDSSINFPEVKFENSDETW